MFSLYESTKLNMYKDYKGLLLQKSVNKFFIRTVKDTYINKWGIPTYWS